MGNLELGLGADEIGCVHALHNDSHVGISAAAFNIAWVHVICSK